MSPLSKCGQVTSDIYILEKAIFVLYAPRVATNLTLINNEEGI
jgi:hypothetical protein